MNCGLLYHIETYENDPSLETVLNAFDGWYFDCAPIKDMSQSSKNALYVALRDFVTDLPQNYINDAFTMENYREVNDVFFMILHNSETLRNIR